MKAIDLTQLIEGLIVVILIALAVDRYGDLRRFAVREAAASLRGWDTHAFFPETYRQIVGPDHRRRVHLKGAAGLGSLSHPGQLNSNRFNKGDLQPIRPTIGM